MRVEVFSAYVAGAYCAQIEIPNRQVMHLERRSKQALERAVRRHVVAAAFPPPEGETIHIQWHEMRRVGL